MTEELNLNSVEEIVKALKHPFTTLHRVVNTSLSVIVVAGGVYAGYMFHYSNKIAEKNTNQLELLNKYYIIQNQQTVLLKIIDQNLRDNKTDQLGSAPLEEKVAVAKIMYELSNTYYVELLK